MLPNLPALGQPQPSWQSHAPCPHSTSLHPRWQSGFDSLQLTCSLGSSGSPQPRCSCRGQTHSLASLLSRESQGEDAAPWSAGACPAQFLGGTAAPSSSSAAAPLPPTPKASALHPPLLHQWPPEPSAAPQVLCRPVGCTGPLQGYHHPLWPLEHSATQRTTPARAAEERRCPVPRAHHR